MIAASLSGLSTGLFTAFVGVFGLLIGSFLNVVVYRVPQGLSLVAPPSACPNCGMQIKPYDNVPVLSWLVLKARCRGCGTRISMRYPLVEAGTGLFFAAIALWSTVFTQPIPEGRAFGSGLLVLIAFLYLAAISVALGLIDVDTHRLPNAIVLPSYLVAIVLLVCAAVVAGTGDSLLRAGIGMAAMLVFYGVMAFIYPAGMGFGDVKLAGLVGLYLGWVGWGALIVGAFAAFLLGGIYALALIFTKRATRKSGVPFGPWMLAAAWLGIVFGNSVFGSYLTFFGLQATK